MRKIVIAVTTAALLFTANCIDYREEITLNADGSGSLKLHYAMEQKYMDQLESMSRYVPKNSNDTIDDSGNTYFPDREKLEKMIDESSTNVNVLSYLHEERGEWMVWEVELAFASLQEFADLGTALTEGEEAGIVEVVYEEQEDGTYLFRRYFSKSMPEVEMDMGEYELDDDLGMEAEGEAEAETSEDSITMPDSAEYYEAMDAIKEAMAQMSEEQSDMEMDEAALDSLMAGFAQTMAEAQKGVEKARISLVVNFTGEVIESNATSAEGNTATWEYKGESIMYGMPQVLEARVK